jgi:GNAT superfamily N-acetyltransferase
MRRYQNETDYWRIREFLREVFLLNGKREISWHVSRLDYWCFHENMNIVHFNLEDIVFLWETENGRIAAVLNPESKGEAYLQIHPDFRSPQLLVEMMETAEQQLTEKNRDGKPALRVWVHQAAPSLTQLLEQRGYEAKEWLDHKRRRSLDIPIPEVVLPEGYTIRALGGDDELPMRSLVSWRAFHPGEPEAGQDDPSWYRNIQTAPLYRRDLDLVAVDPNGQFAGFTTVWFDDVTRTAVFEPVGVDPAYQRRGIARALMHEGLRRAKRIGATLAFVGSFSEAAHKTYASAGFTDFDLLVPWIKTF